jgi:hypothetical protein
MEKVNPYLMDAGELTDEVLIGRSLDRPVKISRSWAMPNAETFSIPPIKALLARYDMGDCIIDPFARSSSYAPIWSNDLSPSTGARFHLHAEEFADLLIAKKITASFVLFDPPYSMNQIKEVYQSVGREWGKDDAQQMSRWARLRTKLGLLVKVGGIAVSFGWSTTGFGRVRDFLPIEYLIVNHGSGHHDTLCTVERKTHENH